MQTRRTISSLPVSQAITNYLTSRLSALNLHLPMGVKQSVFGPVAAVFLLLHAHPGQAQFDRTPGSNQVRTDSSQGYWRLKTHAATRSTGVQFFSPYGQLLYEEIIPGKWVKLSRKNQKQVDQLLAQLVAGQLLTSRIKTETLPATPFEPDRPEVSFPSDSPDRSSTTKATYQIQAYINPEGKLYVVVNNPNRLRYAIRVVDQRDRSLYEEFTNLNRYRRRLDVSSLPVEAYQLVVHIDNKPFTYRINKQRSGVTYTLLPPVVDEPNVPVEPNPGKEKPSLLSVTLDS